MEDWSSAKLCDVVNLFLGTILFVIVDVVIGIVVAVLANVRDLARY